MVGVIGEGGKKKNDRHNRVGFLFRLLFGNRKTAPKSSAFVGKNRPKDNEKTTFDLRFTSLIITGPLEAISKASLLFVFAFCRRFSFRLNLQELFCTRRPSGQAVATGVFASPPRYAPYIMHRCIPTAGRFSLGFTNLRFCAFSDTTKQPQEVLGGFWNLSVEARCLCEQRLLLTCWATCCT